MKEKFPATLAIRFLETNKVPYTGYLYKYEEHGGTSVSARELGVDEHKIVKTLIMEDENKEPFVVLMHGDMQVSTKELARLRGVKTVVPCKPDVAGKHSGYLVGGTSPFATKKDMMVYVEQSIIELDSIFINGGKRGFLVEINPKILTSVLCCELTKVGINERKF